MLNLSRFFKQWRNIARIITGQCYGHWTVSRRASISVAGRCWSSRQQIISRYVKFVRGLLSSPSEEVALVANIVSHDMGSTIGRNMAMIRRETGLNTWVATPVQVRDNLPSAAVPQQDKWRLNLLQKYIVHRRKMEGNLEETQHITLLINSLCIN